VPLKTKCGINKVISHCSSIAALKVQSPFPKKSTSLTVGNLKGPFLEAPTGDLQRVLEIQQCGLCATTFNLSPVLGDRFMSRADLLLQIE
jgi:hypothetical protein